MNDKVPLTRIAPYLRFLIQVLLIAFFLWYAFSHWGEMADIVGRLSFKALLGCMSVYCLSHFMSCASTMRLLTLLGYRLRYRDVADIYFRCLPAKYLPGGIWHAVGRGGSLIGHGVSKEHAGQTIVFEQVLAIWWSGFLGLSFSAVAFANMRYLAFGLLSGWIAASAAMFVFGMRTRLSNVFRIASDLSLCAIYILGWAVLASAFCLYLLGGGMIEGSILQVAAGYLLSWMLGAIAFFAPQGLGVFEFAMTKSLEYAGDGRVGLVWFIGSYRLVVLIADVCSWGTWGLWCRIAPAQNRTSEGGV